MNRDDVLKYLYLMNDLIKNTKDAINVLDDAISELEENHDRLISYFEKSNMFVLKGGRRKDGGND